MAAAGGTYVTLVPPRDLSGITIIVETLYNDACLQRNYSNFEITFTTSGGLPGPGVRKILGVLLYASVSL